MNFENGITPLNETTLNPLLAWRGEYDPVTEYNPNDVVTHNNLSYRCKTESTGNLPTNITYWEVLGAQVLNVTGNSTQATMSQKAITDSIAALSNESNRRDDNCLSFNQWDGSGFCDANLSDSENRTRIYTDTAGDTWLATPGKDAFGIREGLTAAVALATLQVDDNDDLYCVNLLDDGNGKCPLKYEQETGELYLVTY